MSSTASTAPIQVVSVQVVPVQVVQPRPQRRALSDIRRGDVFQDVNPFAHLDARRLIQGTPVQIGPVQIG
jgi:hypothetical protein